MVLLEDSRIGANVITFSFFAFASSIFFNFLIPPLYTLEVFTPPFMYKIPVLIKALFIILLFFVVILKGPTWLNNMSNKVEEIIYRANSGKAVYLMLKLECIEEILEERKQSALSDEEFKEKYGSIDLALPL